MSLTTCSIDIGGIYYVTTTYIARTRGGAARRAFELNLSKFYRNCILRLRTPKQSVRATITVTGFLLFLYMLSISSVLSFDISLYYIMEMLKGQFLSLIFDYLRLQITNNKFQAIYLLYIFHLFDYRRIRYSITERIKKSIFFHIDSNDNTMTIMNI